MGLDVRPYPGFGTFTLTVPSVEWAKAVALSMIDESRHYYLEPQPDDHWRFTVDSEHEEALRRHAS